MKYYTGVHTFSYNWDQVATAFWSRYPNPYSDHVLTEDVVQRFIDKDGNLNTKRLISKTNPAPKWTERFLPSKNVYIIEESIVDPKNKMLVTYTRNIGMKGLMTIDEKVIYKPGSSSDVTVSERQGWVDSKVGYGLSMPAIQLGYRRFKRNVTKACVGFQFVLDQMFNNGEMMMMSKTLDASAINPQLKQTLRGKASEFAAAAKSAKSKAVPFVAAQMTQMTNEDKE